MTNKVRNVEEYISGFPEEVREILEQVRAAIRKATPEAEETIGYAMPTYKLNGNLIHFAAYKNHIGLYPTPNGIEGFKEELSKYKGAKGSVQFPIDKPMPLDLISRITKFRVEENLKLPVKKK
ncbi:iron chaperone [Pedobacter frigoris]|uniref:YdhG-like domain-containing protein n=1 Tax=Pedobacter frigoris TaxID=2571272 RepID=A0A4U1CRQ5_9SPHI|nr:DUF1801 domain-containing protein [Pedobacter frigoris]TKC08559.1 hypothetical protein FA047_00200 [Pedobacter frigoris]